jgi:hypothetical protein
MSRIQEVTVFAYATKGEALEIANNTVEETLVAAVHIMGLEFSPLIPGRGKPKPREYLGQKPAELPVCYLVIPVNRPLVPKDD